MFTADQYKKAIASLTAAQEQLAPDGRSCAICGGVAHQAFDCGHNPLVAMKMCEQIHARADDVHAELHSIPSRGEDGGPLSWEEFRRLRSAKLGDVHEFIHALAGFDTTLGVNGPGRVVLPKDGK